MLKYLFSLNFFKSLSLLLLLSSSTMASDDVIELNKLYKATDNPDDGYVICVGEGPRKLRDVRHSQIEAGKRITTQSSEVLELVSNKEGCYFRNTDVIFLKMSEEYSLPTNERHFAGEDGDEPCTWDTRKSCIIAPPAQYIEASALSINGVWYDVIIEISGHIDVRK